jgi:hypothetical protein
MTAPAISEPSGPDLPLSGILHAYVAFDWGDEVDMEHARRLVPAEVRDLPRRRRTPPSIAYRPPPLRFRLEETTLELPSDNKAKARVEATVFDFAATSVELEIPFSLNQEDLLRLAGWLADPAPVIRVARAAVATLHQRLLPAIRDPEWREDLSEEYFVFQFSPGTPPPHDPFTKTDGSWLAELLRLETVHLSESEIREALRLNISYSPDDLFVPDWAAAVLFDVEPACDETLQIIEFANLQLLEYRNIDDRLDANMAGAYRLIRQASRRRLPFWHGPERPLRVLGEFKVEANELFERTGNALKLVGDQYLARVYDLLVARFHLKEWEESIRRKLEVAEGVYKVVSDQAAGRRMEFMEIIVILLIVIEVVLGLVTIKIH